ncbi:histidine phosphatase family protein [Actinokineospora soli]|uniref:Histidine phosphatase family protein n=1 Tax=Actinokineospora soli TaxID=1048753 RepID=A0ABW2TP45_9PSEU
MLIRHAESEPPRPDGPDDLHRPLTARGHRFAELLADTGTPTAVYSSPYLRAVQTVTPLARAAGLPVRTRWELREWDSGLAPTPDYAEHYAASWADPTAARPGGESLDQLTARALAAVAAVAGAGTVVIGSHGTFVSRLLVGLGVAVDWPFSHAMPMPAVYRFRWGPDPVVRGPGL